MKRAGCLTLAGEAAIAISKKSGRWTALDDVEDLVVPADLEKELKTYSDAQEYFDAFPRSVRRGILEWIQQAKRPETRVKRIEETARLASQNERANQWKGKDGRAKSKS